MVCLVKTEARQRCNPERKGCASAAKSLQSCPTLCDPRDGSPPGFRSLGFSRQEHWSGLPFPSPMPESEKWKWSCSVVSDPQRPHGLQPTRLLRPWDFLGKSRVPLPSPSGEEERSEEVVKSFIQGSSSGSLSSFRPIMWLLFPHLTYLWTLWVLTYPSPKMDLEVKASGRSRTHYGLVLSLLTHKGPFYVCVVSPFPKKTESRDALILYSIRLLTVFVLAMTITLTIAMIITLRCLQETNTGYYPVSAVSSISEGKREADCKCLNLSPSIFCLRKC